MSPTDSKPTLSRRQFFKDAGGLLIAVSFVDSLGFAEGQEGASPGAITAGTAALSEAPPPRQLDAWLRIANDGAIHVFTGKMDIGMGVETAFMQIVAEELDVRPERVSFVMADTAETPNQGGVGGSTSIMMGAKPLRNAAATARYLLLQMASQRLGVPAEQLQAKDGVISIKENPARSVSYAELAGGSDLKDTLKVSGEGFGLNVQGQGKPKDPASYTVVGKPLPRVDLPGKLTGQFQYVTDVRVPGMLHGRVIRPAGVGAKLQNVDDGPAKSIRGYVKTVTKGDFVGVVAETEWAAIKAAKAVKVSWSAPQQAFPEQKDLYQHMRSVKPKATLQGIKRGDAEAAMAAAAKKVQGSYAFSFQCHSTMGPGCAVADVRPDGVTTVYSGAQKPHDLQKGFAELLGVPHDKVRVVWFEDAGSYGRPGFEDAAADAVMMSHLAGKPVRVQWMRHDMTGWGPKGPAVVYDLDAGLDSQGKVIAFQYTSRAFSGGETMYRPDAAGNYLAGQLSGIPNTSGVNEFADYGNRSANYGFPNVNAVSHVVPEFYPSASPLRTTHLRDPEGPQTTFAVESFMDEVAAAAGMDPVEFRLAYLEDPRSIAAIKAATEKAGWDKRPSPKKGGGGNVATGRGIAFATRNGTYVATVAEVEVHRGTGAVRVKRFVCAHDCGLVINPNGLEGTIQANLLQSTSRALKEEVTFSRSNVTSMDWKTYRIVKTPDIPDQVDVVILNHPEIAPGGAGEPSSRPTAAAIANAIFDATGARVREAPFTAERVKAAMKGA